MTPIASFLVLGIDDPRVETIVLFAASSVALPVAKPFFTVRRDAVALGKAIGSQKSSKSVTHRSIAL